MDTSAKQKMTASVAVRSTEQLVDMHGIASRQVRTVARADRRAHALVLLSIEAELMGRGVTPPSRTAA